MGSIPHMQTAAIDLPYDIQHLIMKHLNKIDRTCFGLAHRTFMETYETDRRRQKEAPLHDSERTLFLLRLERDASVGRTHYYCDGCNILHPWDRSWSPTSATEKASWVLDPRLRACPAKRFSHMLTPLHGDYSLAHHHVRLVMNAHRWGSQSGLPISRIEGRLRETLGPIGVTAATTARIHGRSSPELVIRCEYAFELKRSEAAAIREYGVNHPMRLCHHLTLVDKPFSPTCVMPWHALQHRRPREWISTRECSLCLTETDVNISWSESRQVYTAQVCSYHILGDGHDSKDWKWASLTGTDTRSNDSYFRRLATRGQSIIGVWEEAGFEERLGSTRVERDEREEEKGEVKEQGGDGRQGGSKYEDDTRSCESWGSQDSYDPAMSFEVDQQERAERHYQAWQGNMRKWVDSVDADETQPEQGL
ncbi:hypothetical protein ACJ41O_008155 [Fusarium nematophilum]